MGVDGRIFPVGTKPAEGGLFYDDWFPVQEILDEEHVQKM